MSHLKINRNKADENSAKRLAEICPFSAIRYENGEISIDSGCRMCKICVKKGPAGLVEFIEEEEQKAVDKSEYSGIAVFAEYSGGEIHKVAFELIGKARELAGKINFPVYALLIGGDVKSSAEKLLEYGADKVFVYDYPDFIDFKIDIYANAFEDFISKVKPSSVMVGATNLGRMLAPYVAARFKTGLTADCTMLEIRENTDLVQIRPAFGGNIMAQIVTSKNRPQFCTVRYKVFSSPPKAKKPKGEIVNMELPEDKLKSEITIIDSAAKPRETDISEADVIIAVGRGVKNKSDLAVICELAELLNAQIACTRPLIECGWLDPRRQIGLSGRTVKAKLIITAGISGSVQFAAGMQGSECIVAINSDPSASIFDIAHYGILGDLYEVVPMLINRIKDVRGIGLQ